MTDAQEPREKQEADVETNGLSLSSCPPGVLLLLKRAANDPEFKAALLQQRSRVAADAEVELTPDEESWLDTLPAPQLETFVAAAAGRSRWAVFAAAGAVIFLIIAALLVWQIARPAHNPAQFTVTPMPDSQPHSHPMISALPAAPAATTSVAAASAEPAVAEVPSGLPAASAVKPSPSGEGGPSGPGEGLALKTEPKSETPAATSLAPITAPVVVAPSPALPVTALVPPLPAAVETPGVPTPAAALAPALFFIPDVLYATVGPVDLVATSDSIFVGQLIGVAPWTRAGDAWISEAAFTCQTTLRGPAAAGQTFRTPAYVLGDSSDPAAPFAFWRRVNLKASDVWLVFTSGGEIRGLCPLPAPDSPVVAQVKLALKIHAYDEAKRWPHLNVELSRIGLKNDFLSAFAFEELARSLAPKAEAADILNRAALNRANATEPRHAAFWALGWLAKVPTGNDDARKTQVRALTFLIDDAAALGNAESSIRNAYIDALGAACVSTGTFERPKLPDHAALQSNPAALIKALRAIGAAYEDQARKLDLQLATQSPSAPASATKGTRTILTPDQIAAIHSDIRLAHRRQEICLRMIEALGGEAAPPPVETPANWGPTPAYGPVWPYGYGAPGYPIIVRPVGHSHDDHHAWPPTSAWPPHSGLPPHH